MQTSDFRNLRVWQLSFDMVLDIYKNILTSLPYEEKYALSDQIRRCSVSIPSNIAEGQARNSDKEFIRFLSIARGSKAELETQLLLCSSLGFIEDSIIKNYLERLKHIDKMLSSLMESLERSGASRSSSSSTSSASSSSR